MRENAPSDVGARPAAGLEAGLDPWGVRAVGRRIACVWLPRFGLTVASRLDRTTRGSAADGCAGGGCAGGGCAGGGCAGVALYRPGTRWQELLECAPDLERAGIRPGLPLKEAQARAPRAIYLPGDGAALAAIATAFPPILDALDAFSPLVEPAPEDDLGAGRAVAYVDITGLNLLYGPELRLGEGLATAAAGASGGAAYVGIAASKFVAWVASTRAGVTSARPASQAPGPESPTHRPAARTAGSRGGRPADKGSVHQRPAGEGRVMVVPAGGEATFLEPLPLETLPLALPARRALERLGVRTLGAFARLPANAVAHRYGAPGLHSHRLAQGIDDAALRPRRPRPAARVELAFDWEETELDRLTFALKTLADQLAARLAALGDRAAGDTSAEGGDIDEPCDDPAGDGNGPWPDDASDGAWPNDDIADPWPDDESASARPGRPADVPAPPLGRSPERPGRSPLAVSGGARGELRGRGGRAPAPGREHRGGYAAEALRVIWRLSDGEAREMLLQLAEPGCSATLFTEHLRWHAEGLDRFLARRPPRPVTPAGDTPAGAEGLTSPDDAGEPAGGPAGELRYEPMEQRQGVIGIALEAVGLQVPLGTQLKLLASPLQWSRGTGAPSAMAALDPVTRARHARRTVARLQARWGPAAVQGTALTPSRLPERRARAVEASLGLQLPSPASRVSILESPDDDLGGLTALQPQALQPQATWTGQAAKGVPHGGGTEASEDVDASLLEQGPLWLVDPPQAVRVLQAKRKGERPRLSGWSWPAGVPRERRIVRWGGPWKVTDPTALATGAPARRDYYQIETEDGGAYLVYWDRVADAWFLQGIFD